MAGAVQDVARASDARDEARRRDEARAGVGFPADVDALRRRGNEAFARGAHDEARAMYDEALATLDARESAEEGGRAVLLANRAACWARAGEHARCAEDCDRAIALDEGYVKAYYRRARAREAMGDLEGALEDFERARGGGRRARRARARG